MFNAYDYRHVYLRLNGLVGIQDTGSMQSLLGGTNKLSMVYYARLKMVRVYIVSQAPVV